MCLHALGKKERKIALKFQKERESQEPEREGLEGRSELQGVPAQGPGTRAFFKNSFMQV